MIFNDELPGSGLLMKRTASADFIKII